MSLIKHMSTVSIAENAFQADDATATLTFPEGQVVSDDSDQRNGTRYEIESMQVEFNGSVTADHAGTISSIVAKTSLFKRGREVVMNAVQFAVKENPLAQIAYDLYKNGYAKDFSIETYGPWPDENGLIVNSKLTGLSCVVTGNNKSASLNSLLQNSLATARKNGLDTTEAEKIFGDNTPEEPKPKEAKKPTNNKKDNDMKFVTIKNSRDFAVKVKYKNASDEEVETELAPGAGVDVAEEQKEAVEKQVTEAKAPVAAAPVVDANSLIEALNKKFEEREQKQNEKFEALQQNLLDKGAQEPQFQRNTKKPTNGIRDEDKELAAMDWEERTVQQIESARLMLTNHDFEGQRYLNRLNNLHLNMLKEKGIVKNSVDLSGFGNFVTSPELLSEIEGVRSDYSPLVDAVGFKETLSLEMAWLKRNGDIEMEEVGSPEDPVEGLKPISQYSATPQTAKLMEVAAVTPVSNSATRFLAVDLLSDVAEGYRTSYQRKLAQIIVARMQQALAETGNSVAYNLSTEVEGLISLANAVKKIANVTANGTFVFSVSTELELFSQQLRANLTGDSLALFQKGPNGMTFMGRPYIVVPDDILPELNSAETRSFVVEGVTVHIDQAIFYADLNTISGRVSGGLNYSLSTEAAYEQEGVVKSAFQRDELLLRGFFYRNAAVRNTAKVGGVHAGGIS